MKSALPVVAVGCLCAVGFRQRECTDGPLVLAERGGAARYTVVLPADPSPSQVTAAKELVRYVDEMTGVLLPVETNTVPERAIFLGNGTDDLGTDGFHLRATPPHFRIEGGCVHGTLFGVYDFLERHCGCDWLSPTTSVIPGKDRLTVAATLDDVQKPAFALRDMNWTDQLADWTFTAKLKMNGFRTVYPESLGGQNHAKDTTTGGATFDVLCPPAKYFKDHPDWFALVDGKRRGERSQRCLTNAGFLDFLVDQMRERIRKNYPRCKYYSIYPNDFRRNCKCASCKSLDDGEETPMASLLHMANYVAERIADDWPDVSILTFSYLYTLKPPKTMTVHPNVMICYCTDAVDFSKPIPQSRWKGNKAFVEDFTAWKRLTDRIYIWDYSANFKYLFQPFECCHVMPDNFRYFRDIGVVGVFEEGDHYGVKCVDEALKTWIIGHLLWNPDQPLDPLLSRFFKGYYGAAADVARGYYDALVELEAKRDETKYPLVMMGTVLQDPGQPRTFFDVWAERWTTALDLVKDDPVRHENVYWARHNVDLVRLMRADCAVKYSLTRTGADALCAELGRLKPVAERVLADFRRVKGLNKFRDNKAVRTRAEAIAMAAITGESTGRAAIPASDLIIDAPLKKAAMRVDDANAMGGKAIRLAPNAPGEMVHCIAFAESSIAKDPGIGIKVRVHARVEKTGVEEGSAFSVGTCDTVSFRKRDIRDFHVDIKNVSDGEYRWYDVDGVWRPTGNERVWISNGRRINEVNPCVNAVFVDQIELSRAE